MELLPAEMGEAVEGAGLRGQIRVRFQKCSFLRCPLDSPVEMLRRHLEIDSGFHSQAAQLRQLLKRLMGPKAPSELACVLHCLHVVTSARAGLSEQS